MNDGFFDQVKLETLHDMGVINDADFNRGRQSVQDAIDVLNNIRELSANEVTSYENGVADKLLQDKEHFNIVPPKLLGQLYESKQQQMAAALQSDPNANVSGLQADIDQIQNRMDELTDMAVNKQELFYSDFTNIGDTYEGYVVMFDARKKYAQKAGGVMISFKARLLKALIRLYTYPYRKRHMSLSRSIVPKNKVYKPPIDIVHTTEKFDGSVTEIFAFNPHGTPVVMFHGGGERLTYEVFGTIGEEKFFVYVDPCSGEEVRVLMVVDGEQGELLM